MPWEPLPSNPEKEPSGIGESLDRLVKRLGAPSASAIGGLFEHWAEVVGEQVAEHTKPVTVHHGTLVVQVSDPAWAPQLRFLEIEVLARAREVLGEPGLERLQVRVEVPPKGS